MRDDNTEAYDVKRVAAQVLDFSAVNKDLKNMIFLTLNTVYIKCINSRVGYRELRIGLL